MTYYICHGPDAVHFIEVLGNSEFSSGQPIIEQYEDYEEAKARAIELGYEFDPEDV